MIVAPAALVAAVAGSPSGPLGPLESAILGLVEGITEYLPVSSTGHLILTSWLLGRHDDPGIDAFEIVIQFGAILAVLGLYRARVAQMASGVVGRDGHGRSLLVNLVVGVIPALVVGKLLSKWIDTHLFRPWPVAAALVVGGVVMLLFEPRRARLVRAGRPLESLAPLEALMIGLVQCLALWPGTSRSMATIVAGLAIGLTPAAAAEFSFLLALPTLSAATAYKALKDWQVLHASVGYGSMAIGMLVALVAAALAVKAFVGWLGRGGLWPFAIYRIALAAAVFWVLTQ